MDRRTAAFAGVVATVLAVLVGCSTAGQPQAASTPTTVTVTATTTDTIRVTRTTEVPVTVTVTETATPTATAFVPDGYTAWDDGIAVKWSDDDSFECAAESESCWGIEMYTDVACPAGVYVSLDLYRGNDKVDVLDTTTSPRPAGEYVSLVLGQSGNGTGLEAEITDVNCSG